MKNHGGVIYVFVVPDEPYLGIDVHMANLLVVYVGGLCRVSADQVHKAGYNVIGIL